MEERIVKLEEEVARLQGRNVRVEGDKAWETSWARMFAVALVTYVVAAIVLALIGTKEYWLGAFVPTIGYILSTQSLPLIKSWWMQKQNYS